MASTNIGAPDGDDLLFHRPDVQTFMLSHPEPTPGVRLWAFNQGVYNLFLAAGPVFLFGLGVIYAVAYRMVTNVLVLWPLLTPMGGSSTSWTPVTSACRGPRSPGSSTWPP
jgi:hypothetical protein